MPIPNPKQFKDKESFISKCMEIEIGSGKDNEQSYAICNTTWDNRNMSTQQRVNQKLADISNKEELITPNPCTSGYIAIGLKPKGGRMVPNCVPKD
tara:strand:+ start:22591 stop:22878 length:288 start_codon:yes stop_codon:yes gene_type:complete